MARLLGRCVAPAALLLSCAWLVISYYFQLGPRIGIYIAVLGFLAAMVTLWPPEHRLSKACWLGVFFFLMILEIMNLNRDRAENQKQQAGLLKQQQDSFATLLDQNQRAFNETMARSSDIIKSGEKLYHTATQVLTNLTGGNSYAFIVPQVPGLASDSRVPLVIRNAGTTILTGVTLRIRDVRLDDPFDVERWYQQYFTRPPLDIGTLFPQEVRPVPLMLPPPTPEKSGTHRFHVEISAQNGVVDQSIDFRPSKYRDFGTAWAYQYVVTRRIVTITPKANKTTNKLLRQREWSDDLGDGKPPAIKRQGP